MVKREAAKSSADAQGRDATVARSDGTALQVPRATPYTWRAKTSKIYQNALRLMT